MGSDNPILDGVVKDLVDRAEVGFKKYGRYLHDSSDDMLQHMYEELLDAAMYVKTILHRQEHGS